MALTKDKKGAYSVAKQLGFKVAGGAKLFANALVCADVDGFAVPMGAAATKFLGVNVQQVDNTNGQDGDMVAEVRRHGAHLFKCAAFTQAMVGKPAFATDDETVIDASAAGRMPIGQIVEVLSATACVVDIVPGGVVVPGT